MRPAPTQIYRFDGFQVDETNRQLLRDGEPVAVSKKAFDLLLVLMENNGRAVTKTELLDQVWPDQFVEEVNLTVHIAALRKALGEKKENARYIHTIPKHGYRFVADLQTEPEPELVLAEHAAAGAVVDRSENGFAGSRHLDQGASLRASNGVRADSAAPVDDAQISSGHVKRSRAALIAGGALVVLLAVGIGAWRLNQRDVGQTTAPFQQATIEQLTSNSKANLAALSPDGKLFAYASRNRGLESLLLGHVGESEPLSLRPPADVTYQSLKFSPDGGSIYYVVNGGEYPTGALLKLPALGGVPEKLRDNISARAAFSPDMKRIAYVRSDAEKKTSSLFIGDTDRTDDRELVTRPDGLAFRSFSPSWSPDGKTISAGAIADEDSGRYEVFLVSAADGQMRPLTSTRWNEVLATAWQHDGSGLIVVAREKDSWENSQLWRVSYPEGNLSRILNDLDNYNAATVSLSSDGQNLLAIQVQTSSSISVAPAKDLSRVKEILVGATGTCVGCSSLEWMPDGRLLYGARVKDSITAWTMEADGSDQKQLTSVGHIDTQFRVTPDGRYIVFQSNRSGASDIWRANVDGSDMKQLTTGGKNAALTLTPDARSVVYTLARGGAETIWRISIDGGEPVRLSDKQLSWPSVSPDGKLIACGYTADGRTKLALLPIEGGQPVRLFDVPRLANFAFGIRWMPDGKSVTYRDWASGLWRQPIEGGEPTRIEGLPEEKIGSYAWSRDGKQLAFVRGGENREVVLIRNGS
jgi:Tol biopolymer transport system component/DNA-binding winged helix-turn-helix (wHTH) protein